jgi:hypothetical protein
MQRSATLVLAGTHTRRGHNIEDPVRNVRKGTASQAAEKLISVEGDGLQAVHNCFEMNSALAAEG